MVQLQLTPAPSTARGQRDHGCQRQGLKPSESHPRESKSQKAQPKRPDSAWHSSHTHTSPTAVQRQGRPEFPTYWHPRPSPARTRRHIANEAQRDYSGPRGSMGRRGVGGTRHPGGTHPSCTALPRFLKKNKPRACQSLRDTSRKVYYLREVKVGVHIFQLRPRTTAWLALPPPCAQPRAAQLHTSTPQSPRPLSPWLGLSREARL